MVTKLYNGDCLEVIKELPENSIDFILTDLPYGTTQCKWDNIISYQPMWAELKRIRKDNTAIALFGNEPFSSHLRLSNLQEYRYDWIWQKNKSTGFLNAKKMPLKNIENISIFYKKLPLYKPQFTKGKPYKYKKDKRTKDSVYGKTGEKDNFIGINNGFRYPTQILKKNIQVGLHPTQKPTELLEYLIETYTKKNELVLDFTMGSGSTGVACVNTNRDFIGIELDKHYFEIAMERIGQKVIE